ncbi:hypothetical protein [Archangium lansingense]|uniref:Uncharacterized protein n=1 Tax=Archangium lansingense TaxID=2995310 RepID=A0ABT4AN76_9BACT|nr:hypothetical protein [Archangium lansinium]MCY1082624.1 hypothetical protein [Archangium lansinium]
MIRRGGVVQRVDGPVVMWLREAGGLREVLEKQPAPSANEALQGALARAGVPMTSAVVLPALQLGLTAIGFALLYRKLGCIQERLDEVLNRLAELKLEVSWLNRRADAAVFARSAAAIESAQWAERTGRLEQLVTLRHAFTEACAHHQALLAEALRAGRAHAHAEAYGAHLMALAQLGLARARCDSLLDGPARAWEHFNPVRRHVEHFAESLRAPLRELQKHPELLMMEPTAQASVRETLRSTRMAEDGLVTLGTQLDHCARHRLSWQEWEAIGAGDGDARVLLLLPEPASSSTADRR